MTEITLTEEARASVPDPPAPPRSSRAYRMLDIWRGLAALWVVCYHATDIIAAEMPHIKQQGIFWLSSYGFLGVEVFFVISGYCIGAACLTHLERNQNIKDYARARIRRIYPPYWFSCAFYLLAALGIAYLTQTGRIAGSKFAQNIVSQLSPFYLLTNATLTQIWFKQGYISVVAWTLCYEVAFYGICGLLLVFLAKRGDVEFFRPCYALQSVLPRNLVSMRQAKATKWSPATVSGNRS